MPTNRRNSVACNGIAVTSTNRLDSWRRSFGQNKRTSMLDMNTLARQPTPNQADVDLMTHQKFLFPFPDPTCSFEYSNQIVHIGSHYEFADSEESALGHGAYGDVFKGKAFDFGHQNYRPVAVKRMAEINVKSNELEAMKRVQNPFLVALIDICHDENHLNTYIIMELCDIDLDKYLKLHAHDGLLRPEFNLIVQHLAFAYYALFKERIVHRDIKPQNVLLILSPNGNGIQLAKLTDFGVCRVLEDADGSLSNIAGTFSYMAPEVGANILKTSEYNCTVDMWSIGCVLFQSLTGSVPFEEHEMCKLFLHCACSNFYDDMYPEFPADTHQSDVDLIKGLLEIDRSKRLIPEVLYSMALKRMQNKNV